MSVNGASGTVIAKVTSQQPHLRQLAGAYELVFPLIATRSAYLDPERHAVIHGARVRLKSTSRGPLNIGYARPEIPLLLKPDQHATDQHFAIFLKLSGQQIAAMENVRSGGNVDFELLITGDATDPHGTYPFQDTVNIHLPRSTWIGMMSEARVIDILLLELPIPIGPKTPEWRAIAENIERARRQFIEANHVDCIATCRAVLQELGYLLTKEKEWSGPAIGRLAEKQRNDMTKTERELAIFAAARHYTSQAHHPESEGGVSQYSRSEATMLLSLTSALAARVTAST